MTSQLGKSLAVRPLGGTEKLSPQGLRTTPVLGAAEIFTASRAATRRTLRAPTLKRGCIRSRRVRKPS